MYVPCNVSSDICAENTLLLFCIKKNTVKRTLNNIRKNTGSSIYVCIGKDELRPIVNYDKTIFYEPEKNFVDRRLCCLFSYINGWENRISYGLDL